MLGTGWLGLALVQALREGGLAVHASARRPETTGAITRLGARAFDLELPARAQGLSPLLDGANALVITLPPGGRTHGADATDRYLDALSTLQPYLSRDLHVIYTSSTGVYGRTVTGEVTEGTPVAPDTDSSRAVVAAERWLEDHAVGPLSIFRLGGLYGPGRDPVRFFRRLDAIPDGDAPVNMLRQDQAVDAVRFIIRSRTSGIFNVCDGGHPSKREFYGSRYREAGLPPKPFLPGGSAGKRIDSSKIRRLGRLEL